MRRGVWVNGAVQGGSEWQRYVRGRKGEGCESFRCVLCLCEGQTKVSIMMESRENDKAKRSGAWGGGLFQPTQYKFNRTSW